MKQQHTDFDIYKQITDKIIAQMEQGIIPWERPWTGIASGATSWTSRKPYSFLNQMLLGTAGEFITWKAIQENGGTLKKGAKAQFVVFWKQITYEKKDKDGNPKLGADGNPELGVLPVLRYYNVYRIEDVEGIAPHDTPLPQTEREPLTAGEDTINGYLSREDSPKFTPTESNRAYYSPSHDEVVVPLPVQFPDLAAYYATAFHELTHSTMTASRCNRIGDGARDSHFGDANYSREELVAEIGSAMLMNSCGIENAHTERNTIAYLQSWLEALKNDKRMIVVAAGRAEAAARFILTGEKKEFAR